MAQAQPAGTTAYGELIHRLNLLVEGESDEFSKMRELKKIETDANNSLLHSPQYLLSVMGSISAIKGNIAAMHQNHKNSFIYGSDLILALNYAESMRVCELYDEAYSYVLDLENKFPDNVTIVDFLADLTFEQGNENLYRLHAARYKDMTNKQHSQWQAFESEMQEIMGLNNLCSSSIVCCEGI